MLLLIEGGRMQEFYFCFLLCLEPADNNGLCVEKQPRASVGIVAANSEVRNERSGLQTLCARADCEYDRGLTARADEV